MATRILLHAKLRQNTSYRQAPLIYCTSRGNHSRLKAMANISNNSLSISPLDCSYPPQAEDPNTHTVARRRCWLLCCVDLGNGHHFTHSTHCALNFTHKSSPSSPINTRNPRVNDILYASNSGHDSVILSQKSNNHPIGHAMTWIRHRMHSRSRSNRGCSTRPTTQPTPDSKTPVCSPSFRQFRGHLSENYLHTRSGRGRAHIHGACRVNATTQMTIPPVLPHPSYHTTQFRFQSMMNQLAILATITVALSEELNQQEPQMA